ncbi:MAG: Gfo/Idh/MocA family oxidoreductase [Polyangiaceae bacterium]|nr:Gfo/Idh/MocA family oxidoreductase [Polyangiaceae bacterium]
MNDVKACVIGLGSMGRNHARVLSDLPGVTLVGVADPSEQSRKAYRRPEGVQVFEDYREMLDVLRPDYAVVATPTELHCEIACNVVVRKIHVLVEKPMAMCVDEVARMIRAAAECCVAIMCGHVERFNPAVQEVRRLVSERALGPIFQLHARRLSPFPPRISNVGVILDLATHDIDAMHFVTGSRVVRAYAETSRNAHTSCEDMLSGLLRFDSGVVGVLDVSWLSPKKLRELWVVGEGGMLVADYLAQEVSWFKNGRVNDTWTPATNFSGAVEGDVIKTYIAKKEPLRAEHEAFVSALVSGLPPPVSGHDALAAVRVALDLVKSGLDHTIASEVRTT